MPHGLTDTRSRSTVYDVVTASIITALENGVVPWRRPWTNGAPRNLTTGNAYRGINALVLALAPFASPFWVTRKQAEERGAHVRAGERYWPAIFWRSPEAFAVGETRPSAIPNSARPGRAPVARFYQVYNAEQCVNLKTPALTRTHDDIAAARDLVAAMPDRPEIAHRGDDAYYLPSADLVVMPPADRFDSATAYYATLFHELAHATGHASRLARMGVDAAALPAFGSADYSREELIAELASAFLCGHAGISPNIERSAAYVAGWLSRLRADRNAVVKAAQAAQKAADWVRGLAPDRARVDSERTARAA